MFVIKIAGIPIGIHNRFSETEDFCREFIVDEKPAFTVAAGEEEMWFKVEPFGNPNGCKELICIHRHIIHKMLEYEAFLMHAAVISVDGEGLAFAAKSGTGKTTRVRLWTEAFGDRANVINGDKPILRFINGEFVAFGTPWKGKENLGSNGSVPLKAICFLERSEDVSIRRIYGKDIMERLFHQLLVPHKKENFDKFSVLINKLLEMTPCFLMKCNKDKENPIEIWEKLKGEIRA